MNSRRTVVFSTLVALGLALVFGGTGGRAQPQQDAQEPCIPDNARLQRVRAATLEVQALFEGSDSQTGIGVFVSAQGHLLVPMHLVRNERGDMPAALRARTEDPDQNRRLFGPQGRAEQLAPVAGWHYQSDDPQQDVAILKITPHAEATSAFDFVRPLDPPDPSLAVMG